MRLLNRRGNRTPARGRVSQGNDNNIRAVATLQGFFILEEDSRRWICWLNNSERKKTKVWNLRRQEGLDNRWTREPYQTWVWDQRLPCAARNQRAEFRAHVRREDGARFNAGEVAYYAERKQPYALGYRTHPSQ